MYPTWTEHKMITPKNAVAFVIIHPLVSHPGSGSDRTIASERHSTALATLYIGGSVTCFQTKTQGA